MRKVGELAPDFTLQDEQGRSVTLTSFRGKQYVVLVFYPGDSTYVCTQQLCELRDNYAALSEVGALVFGLNPRGQDSHQRFTEKHGFPFPLLIDPNSAVARQFGTALGWGALSVTLRAVFVVGLDGRLIFAQSGRPGPQLLLEAIRGADHSPS